MSESIKPSDRYKIPNDLKIRIAPIEREAWIHLRMGRYDRAEALYRSELELFGKSEEKEGRSLHKGAPLHQLGLVFYFKKEFERSVRNFLLAYCEDTLSAESGQEDGADGSPACRILRDRFLIDLTFLRRIKEVSAEKKSKEEFPANPNDILKEAVNRHGADEANLLELCRSSEEALKQMPIDPILYLWPRKVFIGGPFIDLARLRDIQELVIRLGFEPVLTEESGIPEELIHHHNLMMLHSCKYAIFEVSRPAGQLIEIERTRDYGIRPLLVYSSTGEEIPKHVSAMLRTAGFDLKGYRDTIELGELIADYLKGEVAKPT